MMIGLGSFFPLFLCGAFGLHLAFGATGVCPVLVFGAVFMVWAAILAWGDGQHYRTIVSAYWFLKVFIDSMAGSLKYFFEQGRAARARFGDE